MSFKEVSLSPVFFLININNLDGKPVNNLCKLAHEVKLLCNALTKDDKLYIQKDLDAMVYLVESLVSRF